MNKIPPDDVLESLYKFKNTWVWSTQNDGEEKHRRETEIAKLSRQKWEDRNRGLVANRRGQRGVERGPGERYQWKLPNVIFTETESGCKFCKKWSFAYRQVEDQPSKKPKKDGDKNAAALLKDSRQLGCEFQDIVPLESSTILRKRTKVLGPIRRAPFSKATVRHANKHPKKHDLSQKASSGQSVRPRIWGSVSGRDWETTAMCPRRRVEVVRKYPAAQRQGQSYFFLTFWGLVSFQRHP